MVYEPKGIPIGEPNAGTRADLMYCQVHRKIHHPTESCFTLRRIIDKYVKAGTLQIPLHNVNNNPLPSTWGQSGGGRMTRRSREKEESQTSTARKGDYEEDLEDSTKGMDNVVV